jgi:hypothetical protein
MIPEVRHWCLSVKTAHPEIHTSCISRTRPRTLKESGLKMPRKPTEPNSIRWTSIRRLCLEFERALETSCCDARFASNP